MIQYDVFILMFIILILVGLLIFLVVSNRRERENLLNRLMAKDVYEYKTYESDTKPITPKNSNWMKKSIDDANRRMNGEEHDE